MRSRVIILHCYSKLFPPTPPRYPVPHDFVAVVILSGWNSGAQDVHAWGLARLEQPAAQDRGQTATLDIKGRLAARKIRMAGGA